MPLSPASLRSYATRSTGTPSCEMRTLERGISIALPFTRGPVTREPRDQTSGASAPVAGAHARAPAAGDRPRAGALLADSHRMGRHVVGVRRRARRRHRLGLHRAAVRLLGYLAAR